MQRRDFLVLAGLLITGCATKPSIQPAAPGVRFSEADRATVTRFYAPTGTYARANSLPPQRAKVGDLLDSGQRPNKLPVDLAKLLPDLPAPDTRLILGADILLVNRDTLAILDVIPQIAH